LREITGLPHDGYVTIVWDANERPAAKRLLSWVHLNPPNVRKPPSSPISLLTTGQEDDEDDEDSDDDDESPEYKRAKAQVAQLECRIANYKFRAEALILRAEIKQELSWMGPYYTNEDYEYDYQEARNGDLGQKVAAWVDAVEEAMGLGKQGSKRGRLEMEEDEEAVEQLPSPPHKASQVRVSLCRTFVRQGLQEQGKLAAACPQPP
jgi:hypothetical protein